MLHPLYIRTLVALSLAEDVGEGDITTNSLVPFKSKSKAHILAKSDGIICGLAFAKEAFKQIDSKIIFTAKVKDGQAVKKGAVLAVVAGSTRALLTGERVAINYLSYLSAIATKTNTFVKAVKPYKAEIMDTRKTTPLLRQMERYAVQTGGGVNHRFDLSTMAMIKDNHRCFAHDHMSLAEMVNSIKKQTRKKVELEVDDLEQFKEALETKADIILLDNMSPTQVGQAVQLRNRCKSKILLEASGNINLDTVHQYAKIGVERISVGSLTHSRQAMDISLDFQL